MREHQFNFRCVHSELPVSMDVAFGFIPKKTSRFDLAHSEPCARRRAIAVVGIIARILEGSFLRSWLLRGLLQCLVQPPGGASAQRDDPRRFAGDVGLQARIQLSVGQDPSPRSRLSWALQVAWQHLRPPFTPCQHHTPILLHDSQNCLQTSPSNPLERKIAQEPSQALPGCLLNRVHLLSTHCAPQFAPLQAHSPEDRVPAGITPRQSRPPEPSRQLNVKSQVHPLHGGVGQGRGWGGVVGRSPRCNPGFPTY